MRLDQKGVHYLQHCRWSRLAK